MEIFYKIKIQYLFIIDIENKSIVHLDKKNAKNLTIPKIVNFFHELCTKIDIFVQDAYHIVTYKHF